MRTGKTPCPDSYSSEFYNRFANECSILLQNTYNESLIYGCLQPTLCQAAITVLLKKDKNPLQCNLYWPISLLNVDYKILTKLTKILTKNLNKKFGNSILSRFYHKLLTRQDLSKGGTVVLMSDDCLILSIHQKKRNQLVVSLDKTIITKGQQSDYFPLRGTYQGSPLSGLGVLFTFRQSVEFWGI